MRAEEEVGQEIPFDDLLRTEEGIAALSFSGIV